MTSPLVQAASAAHGDFVHEALFYTSEREHLDAMRRFVEDGLAAGDPVLAVLARETGDRLRGSLNGAGERVRFTDMTAVGRNPGRILSTLREFAADHPDRRARMIGEPIWPGRSPGEIIEATCHEALINAAFTGHATTILCPYDARRLDPAVLADATRTHPSVVRDGALERSSAYTDPAVVVRAVSRPLAPPPASAAIAEIDLRAVELAAVRARVAERAQSAGLGGDRLVDLLLAVTEAVTNSLIHTAGSATLRAWPEGGGLVCEIADEGVLTDLLAGRQRPRAQAEGGRGLWLIHQLCDLVEVRSGRAGTVLRLHVRTG